MLSAFFGVFVRLILLSAVLSDVALVSGCNSKQETPAPSKTAEAQDDKTFYALGLLVSKNLEGFQLTPQELEQVKKGLSDGVAKKQPMLDADEYRERVQKMHETRMVE